MTFLRIFWLNFFFQDMFGFLTLKEAMGQKSTSQLKSLGL